jgi:hypothetical protein
MKSETDAPVVVRMESKLQALTEPVTYNTGVLPFS